MKKTSLLLFIGVFVFVLMGLYTGYVFGQKNVAEEDLQQAETALITVQNEFLKYENKDIESAIAAKQALNELSDTIIRWSKIIKEIRKTVPEDKKGRPLLEILSYSGSGLNELSMNMKTFSYSDNPYEDAADLIEAFDDSKYFISNFVPSISRGSDVEGAEVLTFMFSTRYVEEDVAALVEEASREEVVEKPATEKEVPTESNLEEALLDVLDEGLEDGNSVDVPTETPVSR